jgi:hypothetical protein
MINFAQYTKNGGPPLLNVEQWKELNQKYSKEQIRKELSEYIIEKTPAFPFQVTTHKEMQDNFLSLLKSDLKSYFFKHEEVKHKVIEKFDDYTYSYEKYGMGVIQNGHSYNDCSNYFHRDLRYRCGGWSFNSPYDRWTKGIDLEQLLSPLWRMNNNELSISSYNAAFRLGAYVATQFKPHVAKCLYLLTNANVILDTSCGWGDRLAAFFATPNATEYYGCDPNPETFERYKKQCIEYSKLLEGGEKFVITEKTDLFKFESPRKTVIIQRKPAEDMDWNLIPEVDCAFTSPPYFATEKYATGSGKEEDQSWSRYDTYEKWRDKFYLPVAEKIMSKLSSNGCMMINIMDPKIKNKRYRASDDLIEKFKDKFVGQIGMRIVQRPKDIGDELDEYMTKIYIEPIWCFGNVSSFEQYFDRGTLSNFFE